MGMNRYNTKTLSQLLSESAEILDEEFPPDDAGAAPPDTGAGDVPPPTDDAAPDDLGGDEGGEGDDAEALVSQLRSLVDQIATKLGVAPEAGEDVGLPD